MLEEVKRKFSAVNRLVEKIGDRETIELSKFLKNRITHPDSFAAMLGETSSGKTTLLNGFLCGNYLYTSAKPSTAAIIELECTPEEVPHQYYAILKNATAAKLSREEFIEYSKIPNDNIKRLWMKTQSTEYGNSKMRLFDTPGYGSVIEKHEEVLVEFIPESNIIIYVVSYKVGIQQDDYNFINYISEIMTEGTEFVLVINRVPELTGNSDRRISEIKQYIADLLHYTPKTFLVPNIFCETNEYPLPGCSELWAYLKEKTLSDGHQRQLEKSFEAYVFSLFERCETYVKQKTLAKKLNQDEKNVLITELEKIILQLENAKDELVKPAFRELITVIPSKLGRAQRHITSEIHKKIDASSKVRQEEIVAYVNAHMLQFEAKKQTDEIRSYIEIKLNRLNKQVEDMLNQCLYRIEQAIELHFSVETVEMTKGIVKRSLGRTLEQSILAYFKKFAGNGGTGIANGAKHLLKKFGDLFGKTFSRETHNKLASTLSRIGATSAKAVGIAVCVILEAIFIIVDATTWQHFLKKKVTEGIKKWHDEVITAIEDDLKDLETENLKLLDEHIYDIRKSIDNFSKNDLDDEKIDELTVLLNAVTVEMGEYSYGEEQ